MSILTTDMKEETPKSSDPSKAELRRQARSARRRVRTEARRARRRSGADNSSTARAQILEGAATAFGERGFADSTVEHILGAAGVSRRTFYRFFRNKEEVLNELFTTASLMLMQSIRAAAMLGKTPDDKLENCIEVFLRAPQTAGPITKVLLQEAARPGSNVASLREMVVEKVIELFDEQMLAEDGRRVDPLIYRGLVAALEQISAYTYEHTDATEEDIQRAKAAMMHIVRATLDEEKDVPVAPPEAAPEEE